MASRADLSRLSAPEYDEESRVRRYRLPGEDLFAAIIREMVDESWSYGDWSTALPPYAPAHLAAARLLREQGSNDADKALDAAVGDSDTPPGYSEALHLAGQAEACALKSQWDDSETRYRRAIELMPSDIVRRSWWLNVADLAARLDDDVKRQKALESAKGGNTNDPITKRAIELLKLAGSRSTGAVSPR
jgi:hypothetical protein